MKTNNICNIQFLNPDGREVGVTGVEGRIGLFR